MTPAKAVTRAYHLFAMPRAGRRGHVAVDYLTGIGRSRPVVSLGLAACSGKQGSAADATVSAQRNSVRASPGGSTDAATLPMKVVTHGQSTLELVPVYIHGQGPFVFMLDTGSSVSSVSRRLAARLGLHSAGNTTQIRGVVTSTRVPLVTITGWKLGTAALAPDTVAVLDLSKTGGSVAGLLGSDELRHFGAITVDFQRQQLRLARP